METYLHFVLFTTLICLSQGQYGPKYVRQEQPAPIQQARHYAPDPYVSKTPPPLIISHKQALSHDGGFNYAFAADNGLQQGESIAPDGTRQGGYSYVDPNGKKITIRYTAGKEGFRIVEGDHIPRASYPIQVPAAQPQQQQHYAPQPQYQPAPQQYSAPQTFLQYRRPAEEDDGQYRESYHRPQQHVAPISVPKFVNYKGQASQANAIREEPEYNDEPGKPHSFGTGYAFEFAG